MIRSVVSCRVVYSSFEEAPELRSRCLGDHEILQAGDDPGSPVGAPPVDGDHGGAGLGAGADEGVLVRGAVDLDAIPEVLFDFDARSGRLRRLVDEVVPEGQAEFLDGVHSLLLREGEHRILLGVGG